MFTLCMILAEYFTRNSAQKHVQYDHSQPIFIGYFLHVELHPLCRDYMNIAHSLLVSQTHLYTFLSETHCTCIEARIESRKIKPIL